MTDFNISSGKAMRQARESVQDGVPLILPSGFTVRVKAISLATCVKLGYIPDGLTQHVVDAFNGKIAEADAVEEIKDLAEAKEELGYWEHLCRHCLVEPRVVDDPQADDEISIEDLELVDKQHIAAVVLRPANMLRPFCEQQNAVMESVFTQPEVRAATQPDSQVETVGK